MVTWKQSLSLCPLESHPLWLSSLPRVAQRDIICWNRWLGNLPGWLKHTSVWQHMTCCGNVGQPGWVIPRKRPPWAVCLLPGAGLPVCESGGLHWSQL